MSVRAAMLLSLGDKYASLAVGVVSSMVLARLLAPSEIGTFSLAMVLLSFISAFRDFGVTTYVVQAREISVEQIRGAFSAQLLLGIGIALLVSALSVPAAAFYGDPRIRSIFLVIALIYIVQPFGSITQAWMAREVRFGALAVINLAAATGAAIASVLFAYSGYGPVSLALGNLTGIVAGTAISLRYRPAHFPWRPGLRDIRRILKFGGQSSGLNFVNNLFNGAPELLLGKVQSLAAVGQFSRAQGLVSMFSRLITEGASRVSLSVFAQEAREGRRLGEPFIRATTCVTAIGWVFCLVLGGLADPIVRLMYGSQWTESIPLLRLLSLGLAFTIPATFASPALSATGELGALLRATTAAAVVHIVLIAVAAPFGLKAMGWAAVGSGLLHSPIFLYHTQKATGFAWNGLARGLLRSALAAVGASAGPVVAITLWGLHPDTLVAPLASGLLLTFAGFLAALFLTEHPLAEELRPFTRRIALLARA